MGNSVDFVRLPISSLSREASLTPEAASELESGDPRPAPAEAAGSYLARLLRAAGSVSATQEVIEALPGARTLEQFDSTGSFFTWLSALAEGGDAALLGFLFAHPSRADVEAHLSRLPLPARELGRLNAAICLAPTELRALAAAWQAEKAKGGALANAGNEEWAEAVLETPIADDEVDLWLSQGDDGELDLEKLPAQRGPPVEFSSKLAPRPLAPAPPGCLGCLLQSLFALVFGLLVGGCLVALRSC